MGMTPAVRQLGLGASGNLATQRAALRGQPFGGEPVSWMTLTPEQREQARQELMSKLSGMWPGFRRVIIVGRLLIIAGVGVLAAS